MTSEPDALVAVDPANAEAWAEIEKSQLGDRMKGALRLVASGEPI